MEKKNAFNIMLFVFIIILIFINSCTKSEKESKAGVLLKTDSDFSVMTEHGSLFLIQEPKVCLMNQSKQRF